MFGALKPEARKDHASCSGCSLCLLVCPVWRKTHDPRMTPEGRAKALQNGATPQEIAASIASCTLCGACEPVCPEHIDLVGMTLDLRKRLADPAAVAEAHLSMSERKTGRAPSAAATVFIPGAALAAKLPVLSRVAALLGATVADGSGGDIAQALEAGLPVPDERLNEFLSALRSARTIVVEEGLWLRHLRRWLPKARVIGLGEALSSLEAVRRGLREGDLYVIEPRAYHSNYERLVKHYDRLRSERGCSMNLDLQRIAIPPAGQAAWIVKGLRVDRVVVENLQDAAAFEQHGLSDVVHVAELADH
jgi:ferredoxin